MDFNTTVQNNERDQQVTSFTRGNITMKLLPNFYSLVLQCLEINWLQGRNIKFSLENHRNQSYNNVNRNEKKIIIHETVRRAYFLITELKRQRKKKANLLEKQEHWPYMTNGWHVSVVKTDVQKYSDPQDHKNCTT